MQQLKIIAALLSVCIATAGIAQTNPSTSSSPTGSLALVGGTVYVDPISAPIKNGIVVIQDGVVVAVGREGAVKVPAGIEILNCKGKAIAAGFWNSHVHFLQRKWSDAGSISAEDLTVQLQSMLTEHGFTSVFDTWSNFANTKRIRERIESGEVPGPRIRSNGETLMPKRGVPPAFTYAIVGFGPVTIRGIEDAEGAREAATKLMEAGTDGIKLYAETFTTPHVAMPEDAIAAAFDVAHRHGKLAFAHPTTDAGLLAAVRSGADVIAHTTEQPGPWNELILAAMKAKNVALIPTLYLWHSELKHGRHSAEQARINNAVAQLRSWVGVGGTVLFGTDAGFIPEYETSVEFELMAKAGMTYRQILASLTTAPAEKFGDGKRLGRIAPGLLGDLVVMRDDPAKSVQAFASVTHTIRDGKVIFIAQGEKR